MMTYVLVILNFTFFLYLTQPANLDSFPSYRC